MRRRHGKPTRDDLDLWRRAIRDVRPVHRDRAKPAELDPPVPAAASDGAVEKPSAKPTAAPSSARHRAPHPPASPPPLPPLAADGGPSGLDRRALRRVRRGAVAIEARLDLHGLTQDQAHLALSGFIRRCQADRKRVVLVITGTGIRRDGAGVLRTQVPRWLNEPDLRHRVIHLQTADRGHGGSGAFYVFLRRAPDP